MDKKIFLLDKTFFNKNFVARLDEDILEQWTTSDASTWSDVLIKIDASKYNSLKEALEDIDDVNVADYHIRHFGFPTIRLVIIDHALHNVWFEDVDVEMLEKDYGGSEEKYIKDMYTFIEGFSWDYVTHVFYVGADDPIEVKIPNI